MGKFFFFCIIYSINHYLGMFYTTKGDDGSEIDREWAQGDCSWTRGMFFFFFPPFLLY